MIIFSYQIPSLFGGCTRYEILTNTVTDHARVVLAIHVVTRSFIENFIALGRNNSEDTLVTLLPTLAYVL